MNGKYFISKIFQIHEISHIIFNQNAFRNIKQTIHNITQNNTIGII